MSKAEFRSLVALCIKARREERRALHASDIPTLLTAKVAAVFEAWEWALAIINMQEVGYRWLDPEFKAVMQQAKVDKYVNQWIRRTESSVRPIDVKNAIDTEERIDLCIQGAVASGALDVAAIREVLEHHEQALLDGEARAQSQRPRLDAARKGNR